jgi:hypothetical protein
MDENKTGFMDRMEFAVFCAHKLFGTEPIENEVAIRKFYYNKDKTGGWQTITGDLVEKFNNDIQERKKQANERYEKLKQKKPQNGTSEFIQQLEKDIEIYKIADQDIIEYETSLDALDKELHEVKMEMKAQDDESKKKMKAQDKAKQLEEKLLAPKKKPPNTPKQKSAPKQKSVNTTAKDYSENLMKKGGVLVDGVYSVDASNVDTWKGIIQEVKKNGKKPGYNAIIQGVLQGVTNYQNRINLDTLKKLLTDEGYNHYFPGKKERIKTKSAKGKPVPPQLNTYAIDLAEEIIKDIGEGQNYFKKTDKPKKSKKNNVKDNFKNIFVPPDPVGMKAREVDKTLDGFDVVEDSKTEKKPDPQISLKPSIKLRF